MRTRRSLDWTLKFRNPHLNLKDGALSTVPSADVSEVKKLKRLAQYVLEQMPWLKTVDVKFTLVEQHSVKVRWGEYVIPDFPHRENVVRLGSA